MNRVLARLIPLALALVVAGLLAGWVVIGLGGYTECDRGDCGPVYGVVRTGMFVLLVLLGVIVVLALVRVVWRALRTH